MLAGHLITDINVRLLTNPDDAILNGEDRQRSKESAPRMARLEPTWMYLRRLYDLPVLSVAGTLSITSMSVLSNRRLLNRGVRWFIYRAIL
ncbi:acetyltransferase [Yersinia similis]|nr:acetyltransferase [Yersinia similis]